MQYGDVYAVRKPSTLNPALFWAATKWGCMCARLLGRHFAKFAVA